MPFRLGTIRQREVLNEDLGETFIVPCSPMLGPVWVPDYVCPNCNWSGDDPKVVYADHGTDENGEHWDCDIDTCPDCGTEVIPTWDE